MSEKQRFNLHLPGLLKVLAEHLYSTKKVAVRELLQNAHDSCIRRKLEEEDTYYEPRIDLSVNLEDSSLTITDNGSGLTEEEIYNYLSTIGRGYTRELREKLSFHSAHEASELIGQFGLGFLSAFLIGSEVTVVTRSYKGGVSLKWHSTGDEHFNLEPCAPRDEVGTSITLKLKPTATFLLSEEKLEETVRAYADFLPVPIYMEGDEVPSNLMRPPWEAENPDRAIEDYIDRMSPGSQSLYVIRLQDWKVDLEYDSITIPLQGFLYIPRGSLASVREFGDLRVYIRRMFICDRERDLLPPWAKFVRGVIDCPLIQPTASREGIHQDENFDSVRQAIEEQLGLALRNLAENDPVTWKTIVRSHSTLIVSWAVKDDEFFQRVKDIVPFRTSRGLLTLPEYLEHSGGTLYYVARTLGSLQDQMLAEGQDVPAIEAIWFEVEPFLDKYANQHPEIGKVQLDGQSEKLMRPVSEDDYEKLIQFYEDQDINVKVVTFKPPEVPALMLYPKNAEIVKDAGMALEQGDVPSGLAGLVGEYVSNRMSEDDLRGTLCLNASCRLIRTLAEQPPQKEIFEATLTLLYQMARLVAGRMLNAVEATEAFGHITRSVTSVVSHRQS
ncbi:MAG: ATP-binding protein [Gemmataceae bacterium]